MKSKSEPSYHRMTRTDRLIIEKFYNSGSSFRAVARTIGFAVSSVYSKIQHGLYEHMGAETSRRPFRCSAEIAHQYARFQATSKGPALKLDHNHDFAKHVADQIKKGRSPGQITGILRKNHPLDSLRPHPASLYR